MATPAKTKDIKLDFTEYDCAPGYERWCSFEDDLRAHAGYADEYGFTYWNVYEGTDDGGPTLTESSRESITCRRFCGGRRDALTCASA